jgi:TonB family protein
MRFCRPCFFFAIALLATDSRSAVRAQSDTSPPKQATDQQADRPKRIYAPSAPFPNETLREKYKEGKISLNIVVDSEGRVSHAEALTGPPELFRAAIEYVKQWQYEPPIHAPVTITVEMGWGFPKECPGPKSDAGGVEGSGRLVDKSGKLIAVVDNDECHLPPYPVEERIAGVGGENGSLGYSQTGWLCQRDSRRQVTAWARQGGHRFGARVEIQGLPR